LSSESWIGVELWSSDKITDNWCGVVRLSDGHWHWVTLVSVFGLLDSHFRSDMSVLGGLVTHFREERCSQTEAHGAGSGDNGQENEYLKI
jgi:hypothetical protein